MTEKEFYPEDQREEQPSIMLSANPPTDKALIDSKGDYNDRSRNREHRLCQGRGGSDPRPYIGSSPELREARGGDLHQDVRVAPDHGQQLPGDGKDHNLAWAEERTHDQCVRPKDE